MNIKDKLLNLAYIAIILGFIDVVVRQYIHLEIMYSLNDFFWIISATLLIMALSNHKWLYIIPLVVGIADEIAQYYNLYPKFLDAVYTSTADINDVIAYILGFIVSIIIYVYLRRKYE